MLHSWWFQGRKKAKKATSVVEIMLKLLKQDLQSQPAVGIVAQCIIRGWKDMAYLILNEELNTLDRSSSGL